jgi:hypothetical protein
MAHMSPLSFFSPPASACIIGWNVWISPDIVDHAALCMYTYV